MSGREGDELRRRRLWRRCEGARSVVQRRRGVRQVNRAIESAREMERSASVTYVGHSTGERGSAPHPPVPPHLLHCIWTQPCGAVLHGIHSPESMSVHMYTLREMDVHELGSPGHPRSNHALSCVAFSNKRKRAPLARSTSPAPRRPPRESEIGDGARAVCSA